MPETLDSIHSVRTAEGTPVAYVHGARAVKSGHDMVFLVCPCGRMEVHVTGIWDQYVRDEDSSAERIDPRSLPGLSSPPTWLGRGPGVGAQ